MRQNLNDQMDMAPQNDTGVHFPNWLVNFYEKKARVVLKTSHTSLHETHQLQSLEWKPSSMFPYRKSFCTLCRTTDNSATKFIKKFFCIENTIPRSRNFS